MWNSIHQFKKGEPVPINHPDSDSAGFSEAFFGCDCELSQQNCDFKLSPRSEIAEGECLIRGSDHKDIPKWINNIILWPTPISVKS